MFYQPETLMWFVIIVAVAIVAYVYREKIKAFVQSLLKKDE